MIGEFVVRVSGMPSLLGREALSTDVVGRGAQNEKGRPAGRPFSPKTGGLRGREPLPLGKDLRADGDPGHGSGRPRLMARHRITSFQLLRRELQ